MTDSRLTGLDPIAAQITAALAQLLEVDAHQLQLERPRDEKHGPFSLPCFRFAKEAKKNPAQLAKDLADSFSVDGVQASAVGPFLNFQVDGALLSQTVLQSVFQDGFAASQSDETSLIEFSSPNIAKPMHVGHLRSTVIGASLSRIFALLGHKVVRLNHLGDWGSQFGKLVVAWQRWGSEEKLTEGPIDHLLELYVRYHNDEKQDESLPVEAKQAFRELESGEDNSTRATWKRFTELSLQEFNHTYARLGTEFDFVRGESWYEGELQDTLDFLEEANVLELDDGAWLVKLESEGIETPCLVKTAHGTTLYATRDLAAARSRWAEFQFNRCLYVVGAEQTLHFRQLKAALKRAGANWHDRIEHIPFGLIRLSEGKLSTREGRVLTLAEVLDRAAELARAVIDEKNPDLAQADQVAEQVAVGAIVFHDLKHQRQKDVVFDWDEVLSFEGDTGPYLQYTHARCCSILRKANRPAPNWGEFDSSLLADDANDLLVAIGRFPQAVREAASKNEPMVVAQALLRIAAAGNSFYRNCPVLKAESEELILARLAAMDALRRTLNLGMDLLGVPAPQEM